MSLILSGKAKRGNQEVSFLEILLQWANNYQSLKQNEVTCFLKSKNPYAC